VVGESVLRGAHRHAVDERGELTDDVCHVTVGLAGFAFSDEPRVLGKAAGVYEQQLPEAVTDLPDAAHVLEGHGLPATRVVGDGHEHHRNPVALVAEQGLETLQVHVPLERVIGGGVRPSGITRSTASAPVASTLARVVSKWVLDGTTFPAPPRTLKMIFSAARPWWVGMTCFRGQSDLTASSNLNHDGEPAYDSSPLCIPAHCSLDIAPVPESVSRSIRTSSLLSEKRLYQAASMAALRSASVVMRSGSTEWMRNGSMIVFGTIPAVSVRRRSATQGRKTLAA